jgi:hypothetical protein
VVVSKAGSCRELVRLLLPNNSHVSHADCKSLALYLLICLLEPLQEVEYVKSEDKLARIGEALQKTAPPVLIFAEHTRDVDMVHEYLLTKGVDAVAIHGMLRPGFVKTLPLDLQSPLPSTVTWLKTCLRLQHGASRFICYGLI